MTTGRINQVAFLSDTNTRMRRPPRAPRRGSVRQSKSGVAVVHVKGQCVFSLDEKRPRPHAKTHYILHQRERANTPWATAAEHQHTRHKGITEPVSRPPHTPKGARRMGTPKPSNSFSWVSNTGYHKHPQARSCAGARL